MLTDKVKNSIKRYCLLKKGDKVIVAVSGGADSTAMLLSLYALKKELGISLHVAHLDHLLRPDSSLDGKFVAKLAGKLGLPFTCGQANVKKLALRGSVEEAARNARLNFLRNLAKKVRADKVALGHNLDDQAETVLMRLLRGSGLYGLSGILPKRKINGCLFIRPLIEVKRREIESFLRRKKIRPCQDSSNAQDIYMRNKIRNNLLPLLEKSYNRNIKEVLANTAQSTACDYDYLDSLTKRVAKRLSSRRINLVKFARLHPSLQRLLFRRFIAAISGDTRRLTFAHIKEIEDMLLNRPSGSIVFLPRGVCARKEKKHLVFHKQ